MANLIFSEHKSALKGKGIVRTVFDPACGTGGILSIANDPHGSFYAGTPRVSDGALLFLQHMISKREPSDSRIAIIFNGSPLFTGDAGSGESNIRKWIIESDWLEAIIALPNWKQSKKMVVVINI
jgi:type I restriction-modification system DNA methylase subunit